MNIAPSISIRHPRFHLPSINGIIERRMLVNFRCDPAILSRFLPMPFRPKLVNGWGLGGICLIRLGNIKPTFLPGDFGMRSENAAHRIAVEWDEAGEMREGVFIPRRDTSSVLNRLAGGKLFPGVHHEATFQVWETNDCFKLEMQSADDSAFIRVVACVADALPATSVFRSLTEASTFFQAGALGWSARKANNEFDGLELSCREWKMEPLAVQCVESSFFENEKVFPKGSSEFDSAFLMRNIPHEWRARGRLTIREQRTL